MSEKAVLSSNESKRLGLAIAHQRRKAKLTQERLAEVAGITVRHMQKVEAGHRVPSLAVLAQIRRALKIEWADLFRGV
jgi:transcriptional regulator with XRE-family HTH domain